jgi:hypothetical protein
MGAGQAEDEIEKMLNEVEAEILTSKQDSFQKQITKINKELALSPIGEEKIVIPDSILPVPLVVDVPKAPEEIKVEEQKEEQDVIEEVQAAKDKDSMHSEPDADEEAAKAAAPALVDRKKDSLAEDSVERVYSEITGIPQY